MTSDFSATIEFINRRRAIVTLYDPSGEWSGSGLIEIKASSRSALYEQGYIHASRSAALKGGRLGLYRVEHAA